MRRRAERLLKAMENCVKDGRFTPDYAITLIEDDQRYGWLTDEEKESFYTFLDEWEAEQARQAVHAHEFSE